MSEPEIVEATSGGLQATFTINWDDRRWISATPHGMADFPFIAELRGKRYELYGDGTLDEEEISPSS